MAHETVIQFYRGLVAGIPTLADGEPGWATDTQTLYIGEGGVNYPVTGGGGYTDEQAQDAIAAAFAAGSNTGVNVTYNDGANSLSLALYASGIGPPSGAGASGQIYLDMADPLNPLLYYGS